MVFCNMASWLESHPGTLVTILILIDGFLQYIKELRYYGTNYSHNPYFNRWFSAIQL